MNLLKKMLGFQSQPGLLTRLQKLAWQGTLYRLEGNTRNVDTPAASVRFEECRVSFEPGAQAYVIVFERTVQDEKQQYAFPIFDQMEVVNFPMKKNGVLITCFEWQLEEEEQRVGCFLPFNKRDDFAQLFIELIKNVKGQNGPPSENDEDGEDSLIQSLATPPLYKATVALDQPPTKDDKRHRENLNNVLMQQIAIDENIMVHTCSAYASISGKKHTINEDALFVLKGGKDFVYRFIILDPKGKMLVNTQLTPSLTYEVNTLNGYVKWLDLEHKPSRIISVDLEGKPDAALTLQYNIVECMYEINSKKKIKETLKESDDTHEQIKYAKKLYQQKRAPKALIKEYEAPPPQVFESEGTYTESKQYGTPGTVKFTQPPPVEAGKGLEKYRALCQTRQRDFELAALGCQLQTLRIDDSGNKMKVVQTATMQNEKKEKVNVNQVLIHDNETKGIVLGEDGRVYYQDLERNKTIGVTGNIGTIKALSYGIKGPKATELPTVKCISGNGIYELDPRDSAVSKSKNYATNPGFTCISTDERGYYATGSNGGEIRMYNEIGKNSKNKYSIRNEPVLHLQSTKDGLWLLATFSQELILLPTKTQSEQDLYAQQVPLKNRHGPLRLTLTLEDRAKFQVGPQSPFVAAKFDQSPDGKQKFIISGVGRYLLIWSLANVLSGNRKYQFICADDNLVGAQFKFGDYKKLLLVTDHGITIKKSKAK